MFNAKAKITSHMEDDEEAIWIVKGKTYQIEPLYRFTDEAGDTHYILANELHKYFEVLR